MPLSPATARRAGSLEGRGIRCCCCCWGAGNGKGTNYEAARDRAEVDAVAMGGAAQGGPGDEAGCAAGSGWPWRGVACGGAVAWRGVE